jgi:hypothetical protein
MPIVCWITILAQRLTKLGHLTIEGRSHGRALRLEYIVLFGTTRAVRTALAIPERSKERHSPCHSDFMYLGIWS